jgi:hypothetical protein
LCLAQQVQRKRLKERRAVAETIQCLLRERYGLFRIGPVECEKGAEGKQHPQMLGRSTALLERARQRRIGLRFRTLTTQI